MTIDSRKLDLIYHISVLDLFYPNVIIVVLSYQNIKICISDNEKEKKRKSISLL